MLEDGNRVKTWRFNKNLNQPLAEVIMRKITPYIDMRVKVVYSFACTIYEAGGGTAPYHKSKGSEGSLTSLADIEAFIEKCEMQEPLLGCGPLPDWLRGKRCIYSFDKEDERTDNLCIWRYLVVHSREDKKQKEKYITRPALALAREYYNNPKLKREEVRATKLVDFEGIAKRFKINIRVFEPKTNSEKAPWRLVYGQNQNKKDLDTINLGMLDGHCFYIKKIDVLTQHWECEACKQRFNRAENLTRHKKNECEGKKPTIICKDGYEPQTRTVYEYHGCKWHRCPCQGTNTNKYRYTATKSKEEGIRKLGYNLVTVWECESPPKARRYVKKKFRPYPHYIVFDFEALMLPLNQRQTSDLTYISEHVPVSVAIHDSLNWDPTFLEHDDPKILVERFAEQLEKRHAIIVKYVERMYPRPDDFDMLPDKTQKAWNEGVNQVAVIGFNSGKYDLNMIKRYFVDQIVRDDSEKINVAKKDNDYMFLTTSRFKFLDIKNFLAPGLSYDRWCKSLDCKLEKLVFPYEWLTSYDKLTHVGPVAYEHFYSSLSGKNALSLDGHETFRAEFYKRGCVTMMDWLREYNLADVEPFIEAVDKTRLQYYDDEIDILKDAVSIPGVSMRYVLNKSLRLNPKLELYTPGEPCKHKCKVDCYQRSCKACKKVQKACTECTKNEAYELLQTGMVGGPAIVFCRYHERDVTGIRSHIYGRNSKKCKTILGYDANMLYPSTLIFYFPCGKERLIKIKSPTAEHEIRLLAEGVQGDSLFGFAQVDIEVPKELYDKFSEMAPLFVVKEIPDDQIPEHMHKYLKATGRKRVRGTRKLLGLMKAKKILLYTPVLKWYLDHGLQVTAFYQFIEYERGKPFSWFPEEIADARRQADKDPDKRIAGDTAKQKGNSFHGKTIED
ncbi:uncharacterized protein LOC130657857 [Hydractinia symbiolongicarpus]|uniref:uncharacterized protein LOC130657857 n=1 Tax=Hydractinia symbiolongicarpus TaxID=13093 RepID=UPI00254C3B87|nr:uncharacterized protein LOC130657857 [Hydractinia symbiolongicarpus]